MVFGFIKKFFNGIEKGIEKILVNKILKPIIKWLPPYRDDM